MVKSILALNCGYIQAHKHPGLFHTLLTGVLRITVRMNVALKFHQWNLLLVTALALNCHFHRYIFLLLKLAKLLLACHGVATFSAQENQQWGMGDKALILGLLSCLFFLPLFALKTLHGCTAVYCCTDKERVTVNFRSAIVMHLWNICNTGQSHERWYMWLVPVLHSRFKGLPKTFEPIVYRAVHSLSMRRPCKRSTVN